ncbi:hypothetical protein, partial [Achromobacter spanius]|uniref:hypothetical protein n=1 Tax=Achromobacter spanius TaxID=217203 RepID=UPI003209D14B
MDYAAITSHQPIFGYQKSINFCQHHRADLRIPTARPNLYVLPRLRNRTTGAGNVFFKFPIRLQWNKKNPRPNELTPESWTKSNLRGFLHDEVRRAVQAQGSAGVSKRRG